MPLGVPLAARRQLPLPRKRVSRCRRPLRGGLERGAGTGRAAAEWQQSCGIVEARPRLRYPWGSGQAPQWFRAGWGPERKRSAIPRGGSN